MMTQHNYSYGQTLKIAERGGWQVEDLIGEGKTLDFSRPFMPEALARTGSLTFLSEKERRVLNQLRGYSYLSIFGIVEEFILPFLLDHTRPKMGGGGTDEVRALLRFANEEAKHIRLFAEFQKAFAAGFDGHCDVIGPAKAIGQAVLAHDPLAVGLVILQIEWMTQAHYLESVRDDQGLDPLFKDLLKHHWIEEAQHAKLDTLVVEELARGRTPAEWDRVFQDYLDIGGALDGGVVQQLAYEIEAFERVTGRTLAAAEREELVRVQKQASRYTFIGSGMMHPRFRDTLRGLAPQIEARLAEVAPAFC